MIDRFSRPSGANRVLLIFRWFRSFLASPPANFLAALRAGTERCVTRGVGLIFVTAFLSSAHAQREVQFPPAEGKPPPPAKAPPKTQTGGEETDVIPDPGPTMRKTQERTPPPPTTLTVMYKVEYGEKLKYTHPDGTVQVFDQWQSFPSDAQKLITASNERLADGNNYQYATKPLSSPGFDPVDIPILYMTGDYDFVLTPAEVDNLRKYLNGGGTIIFNAARGLDEFSLAVVREMRKVYPQKQFMRLPLDHPVFNARYRIAQVMTLVNGVQFQQPPEIFSMDVGTRAAAILVPSGLGTAWSGEKYHPAGRHIVGETAWRLGVNLVAYVLGSTEYGRFLAQQFPQYDGQSRPGDVFRYATVVYRGSWDLHPGLHNSVALGLNDNTKIDVDYTPHRVTLDDPQIGNYPLIFMTGHYDFELSPKEIEGLRRYLEHGGMLVASAGAGLKAFDAAFRREIKKAFGNNEMIKLPPTHPLFSAGWNPVDKVTYTSTALRDDPALEYPEFHCLFIDQRPAILYTPFDFQSALNRESNAYAKGLESPDALRVALNVITYALSH